MRFFPYLSIILFALCATPAQASLPAMFDQASARKICAPWDGAAVAISFYHDINSNYPQIRVQLWSEAATGEYMLDESKTGNAMLCLSPISCAPLDKPILNISKADDETQIEGTLEWREQGIKNSAPFVATWDKSHHHQPCG